MNAVIEVGELSKQYRIGKAQPSYATLRDALNKAALAPCRAAARWWRRERSPNDPGRFWALKDVSFRVERGEVVGIIGRNGAGKSTLLKILSRITPPTAGYANVWGRVGSLLEVGTGFHPELTGRENIYLNGAILGMKRAEIRRKFEAMVSFADVDRFIDTPVKHYSSGMHMRLAFAVAAHLEPEVLLIDEVLAVGDAEFQKKCLGKMEDVARQGRTVLFVSHNMAAVRSLCRTGIYLEAGQVRRTGDVASCIEEYLQAVGALRTAAAGESAPRSFFGGIVLNDREGHVVEQGEPLTLSTTLRVDKDAAGFSLGCFIDDAQGRRICHVVTNSRALGWKASSDPIYAVALRIPVMWLSPGLYGVHFAISCWSDSGSARHVSDVYPLDVSGISAPRNAILNPPAEWSVRPRITTGTPDAGRDPGEVSLS